MRFLPSTRARLKTFPQRLCGRGRRKGMVATFTTSFWVLALDKQTSLPEGLTLPELLQAVELHLLGMNRLVGTYQRG